jgi:hypothetical protein
MMECICYLHEAFICLTFDSFSAYARQQAAGSRPQTVREAFNITRSGTLVLLNFDSPIPVGHSQIDLQLKSSLHVVRVEVCSAAALGGVAMGANDEMADLWLTAPSDVTLADDEVPEA